MDDIVFIGGQHIDVDCLAYGCAVGKRAADSELQLTAALPECKAVIEAVEAHLQVVDAALAGEYVEVLDLAAVRVAEHDLAAGHTLPAHAFDAEPLEVGTYRYHETAGIDARCYLLAHIDRDAVDIDRKEFMQVEIVHVYLFEDCPGLDREVFPAVLFLHFFEFARLDLGIYGNAD